MRNTKCLKAILCGFVLIATIVRSETPDLTSYVDPRIGVLEEGSNCVIGPQMPFGSVNPSPDTPDGQHDGYHPERPIRGFSQLHVSGTGWGKYGQILVSPQIGLAVGETEHDSPKGYENATCYEYRVFLQRYHIDVKFTPTHHATIYAFIFPKSDSSSILIDVSHHITRDIASYVGGTVHSARVDINESAVSGQGRYSGGFGSDPYSIYFYAELNIKPEQVGVWKNRDIFAGQTSSHLTTENDRIGAYLRFPTTESQQVLLKIGVSLKNIETARSYVQKEIPHWDYDTVRRLCRDRWNRELSRILVEGGTKRDKKIFYTSLYRCMLMRRDRSGDLKGYAEGTQVWDDQYAVWDTWRTLFPLMNLIKSDMVRDNINSFIARHHKNKWVKDAFIAGNDMAEEQGGNNVDNIIADAFIKDIDGVDWQQAYDVMKYNADHQRLGFQGFGQMDVVDTVMASYKTQGWIPAGIMSCSYTLEYAYNDFLIAQTAERLDKSEYRNYLTRSEKWINIWDPKTESDGFSGFIRPRYKTGEWVPFDPKQDYGSWKNYFYEGSSWTYSYFVPHQFDRLIELMGGREKFIERLEHALEQDLIDYANEPAFLAIRAFHYALRPDLSSQWTRHILTTRYTERGYPGNEDSGAMGSWYVLSAIGLFPNAGQDFYFIDAPLFPKITVKLAKGNILVIEAENASSENKFIQSCSLNGKIHNRSWIRHQEIVNGGTLSFTLDSQANNWGQSEPPSSGIMNHVQNH